MDEQLVSFETAKLANEKGFREITTKCWVNSRNEYWNDRNVYTQDIPYISDGCSMIFQPTQSFLQKWIRETHNIHITIFPEDTDDKSKTWTAKLYSLNFGSDSEVSYIKQAGISNSYEESLEIALFESLKLI